MDVIDIFFIVSACIFPLVLVVWLLLSKEIRVLHSFKAIYSYSQMAVNLNDQLFNHYKVIIFTPSILGIIATTVAHLLPEELSMPIVKLFSYYVTLLVISGAGLAILKTAGTRLLLILLGEIFASWALIGGLMVLGYFLWAVMYQLISQLVIVLTVVLVVLLIVILYFSIIRGIKTYVEGAKQWKQ